MKIRSALERVGHSDALGGPPAPRRPATLSESRPPRFSSCARERATRRPFASTIEMTQSSGTRWRVSDARGSSRARRARSGRSAAPPCERRAPSPRRARRSSVEPARSPTTGSACRRPRAGSSSARRSPAAPAPAAKRVSTTDLARRDGEHDRRPVRLASSTRRARSRKPARSSRVEGPGGGERLEDRDRAAELGVDGGGDRPRQLQAHALRLRALLLGERVEAGPGHHRERQDGRGGEQEQPSSERDAGHGSFSRSIITRSGPAATRSDGRRSGLASGPG